jgi:hypothetical protein
MLMALEEGVHDGVHQQQQPPVRRLQEVDPIGDAGT